jgi:hypothetical protein
MSGVALAPAGTRNQQIGRNLEVTRVEYFKKIYQTRLHNKCLTFLSDGGVDKGLGVVDRVFITKNASMRSPSNIITLLFSCCLSADLGF